MLNLQRRGLPLAIPLLACLGLGTRANAQPAPGPMTPSSLAAVLANMGYETKPSSDGKTFTVVIRSNYDMTVTFSIAAEGSEVLAYIFLQRLTPDQAARLNAAALLAANDAGPAYFSIAKSQENTNVYVQRSLPAAGVTPVTIRITLESLAKLTVSTEALWDTQKWK